MLEDPKNTPATEIRKTPVKGGDAQHPEGQRPWEDPSLSPEERREAYAALVHEKLQEIASAFDRAGEARDIATQKEIMNSPETKKWVEEGTFLKAASTEEFCRRLDRQLVREVLGKNFLGAEAWESQGIEVGEAPPIPESITKALLESESPLHPGEKIKDMHLLVFVPTTVNGEPYSALKLSELCATRNGSEGRLLHPDLDWQEGHTWVTTPQANSEWILIPKIDPVWWRVPDEKHFRRKSISEQQEVHDTHYPEYREAKALELITAVLLNDLTNGEPRMLRGRDRLRCEEQNVHGGKVWSGNFELSGLMIGSRASDDADEHFGRALVWKL